MEFFQGIRGIALDQAEFLDGVPLCGKFGDRSVILPREKHLMPAPWMICYPPVTERIGKELTRPSGTP